MVSDRLQRQIDFLLDGIEAAASEFDWPRVQQHAEGVLALDPENADAAAFLEAARRGLNGARTLSPVDDAPVDGAPVGPPGDAATADLPAALAGGRYDVRDFLGEGGKKRVYRAHDALLDREIAIALIRTEGLDDDGRERLLREAQAMGGLGDHPNVVPVLDFGEHEGRPYIVSQYMGGGDVAALLRAAKGPLPLEQALEIASSVCRGLEFIHRQNLVHHDLKPANVWLTEDGVAKIGDFGIALALDRTRLTTEGRTMPVGTAAYMPPEQAVGGEVTARSDLYSLGAMLYEMVAGRPPFVADDPWAVISQHVEAAPVAPSWFTGGCPPPLEALILRLLEKEPEDRPASASEVLAALEDVRPEDAGASPPDAHPLDRIARGVFVGREPALEGLRAAFDRAESARGGVAMVAGEPGIGKTRVLEELETYVRMRGGRVLCGAARDGGGTPPYGPWIEAIRSYVSAVDPAELRARLGSDANEVGLLAPEVRAAYQPVQRALRSYLGEYPGEQPARAPHADTGAGASERDGAAGVERARGRLFDAVAGFLARIAAVEPLVIMLEDLHWADESTLQLLRRLAAEIADSRLLIVGTYGDTEVGRRRPLEQALAALEQGGDGAARIQTFHLHGLAEGEVAACVRASTNMALPPNLLHAIWRATEGNPFFVSEIVALMAQSGALDDTVGGDAGSVGVPPSLRAVLGRRLDLLSGQCNEMLALAAVAGGEFSRELLDALVEPGERSLSQLLDEATGARLVEPRGRSGEYRFAHTLIRRTLLDELPTTQRVHMQGRVAEALAAVQSEGDEGRAAELAGHFAESATLGAEHAGRAARYSRIAGERAEAVFATAEAIRHYETGLAVVAEAAAPPGDDAATMMLSLGRCYAAAGQPDAALRSREHAIRMCRALGDWNGVARATLAVVRTEADADGTAALLAAALEGAGERDPELEALLLTTRAPLLPPAAAERGLTTGMRIAAQHDLAAVMARLQALDALRREHGFQPEEAGRQFLRSAEQLREMGESAEALAAMEDAARCFLRAGTLDRALAVAGEADRYARAVQQEGATRWALHVAATVALLRADLPRARQLAGRLPAFPRAALEVALAERTGGDAPRGALSQWHDAVRHAERWGVGDAIGAVGPALAAAGDEQLVRSVAARFAGAAALRTVASGSADEWRGALALRLGLNDEARAHFRAGAAWAERERCPLEQARCLLGLAAVAIRGRARWEAQQHLDRAAEAFDRHGAARWLAATRALESTFER